MYGIEMPTDEQLNGNSRTAQRLCGLYGELAKDRKATDPLMMLLNILIIDVRERDGV